MRFELFCSHEKGLYWASLYSRALTTICVDEVPAPRSRPTTVRQGNGGLYRPLWASLQSRALTTICVDEVPAPRSRPTTVRQGNGGLKRSKTKQQKTQITVAHESPIRVLFLRHDRLKCQRHRSLTETTRPVGIPIIHYVCVCLGCSPLIFRIVPCFTSTLHKLNRRR